MAKTATKRRPKVVQQLQMQVDEIARRPAMAPTEERVTGDGEIIDVPVAVLDAPTLSSGPAEAFGRWLLAQKGRGDWIDDLAAAARRDPGFPKSGTPDQVRARMQLHGADGDAFEQLEDAERCWASM